MAASIGIALAGEIAKMALGYYFQAAQLAGKTEAEIEADFKAGLQKVRDSKPENIKDV